MAAGARFAGGVFLREEKMRKLTALFALAALIGAGAGCAAPEGEPPLGLQETRAGGPPESGAEGRGLAGTAISVFNWGDFIDPATLRMFEEETGIRVIYSTYGSNEEMYALLTTGGSFFDILVPSDYMVERLISEDWLLPIDWELLPNYGYIMPAMKNLAFDPDNRFSVPYKWGTMGIMYNSAMVDLEVRSWEILWDERFRGEIFMYDIARDTFAVAQKLLGFSLNTRDLDEIRQARDLLMLQAPLVRAFLQDEIKDMMVAGDGALSVVFSGDAIWSIEMNPDLRYVVPAEGTQLWFNSLVIPRNSRNPEGAHAFINFMNRPDIAFMNTVYTGFTTTNQGAFDLLPPELQNCEISWPSEEALAASEVFTDIGPARAYMERYWMEVLMAGR